MSSEKPAYQEPEKTVQKLKDEREKRIKAEERLKKLEKKSTFEDITVPMQVEQALLEEKNRAQEYLDIAGVMLVVVDKDQKVSLINKKGCEILGYDEKEIIGKNWFDNFIPKTVRKEVKFVFNNLMSGSIELVAKFENSVLAKNGKEKPIAWQSTVLRDDENNIVGTLSSGQDITERKSAEQMLGEVEERYRNLIQNIPVGLFRNTPGAKGKFIMANQASVRICGFEKIEDFLQTPVAELYWEPEKRKIFSEKLIAQGEVSREELLLKKRDGTPFWGAVSAKVVRDESGKIKYFDGIIEDITKQKQAEEALQKSEERFRNIAEETDDWVWEIGIDLVFKYSNSRVKEILGYEPEEVIGKSFLDFMSEKELYRVESKKDYLLHKIIFAGQETYLVRKNGKTIITESSGVPIFRRNRTFIGFQGLTRDITERVQTKEEEERRRQQLIQADKMISLGILVSGVAHEINNPNQFIMVNAPMLQRAWGNITPILDRYYEENGDFMLAGLSYTEMRERIPELFSKIREGSQRIKHIVRNLKDYARESGSEIAQEVDINAVLESALTILSNLLKKSTKKLKVIHADNLPTIRGNFQRIEQVLINLIQNACQALPDPMKGIMITTSYNKKTRKVVVKIKDEGVGIAEDHKKYILDPFFTSRRDTGGTGLGLSISAGIIEEHGGRLEFSSEPGRGTTVSVILPVSRGQEPLSS